jgi:hypothetical protein
VAAASADGPLGQTFRPVQVGSADAIVSALYGRGGKTYVRMYEYRGATGKVSFTCAVGEGRMTHVDLAGRDLGTSPGVLSIAPWQIKTVKFE